MRFLAALLLGCLLLSVPIVAVGAAPETAINNVLAEQMAAWNRGDLKGFVSSYAPHCTLIGEAITEVSREQVLAHYEQKYPSSNSRGTLAFSGLVVHPLDERFATVTGHWHLDREASAGGPISGLFSLVFELHDGNWKILLDHTS